MAEQIKSLKTGIKYKDTPIGKVPVDWEIKNLIDTAKDEPYSFTGGPFGSNLKESSYTDSGVRIIQLQNIGDGAFLNEYQIFTSEEKADQLKSCNIYPGDIIIAKMADPVARACLIPNSDKRYLMASDGIRLSVSEKLYDKTFILYSINSKYFRENAERHSSGTTRLRIGLTELKNLPLAIPPLVEQKKIAEILSTVDEAIEKTDQIIEKTKEAKKGLMQRLLTRGIGHKKFKKTEIGEIPAKWNIESLIEVLVLQRGFDLPVQRRIKGQYPILASNGFIDYHQEFKVKGPGIVTGRSGTLGKVHYIESNYWPLNTTLYVKEFYNNHPKFIYYFLQSLSTEKYGTGTGVPTLNRNILHKVKVAIPPLDEQIKIAEIISESDAEIEKEVSYRADLERIKTGLMQVLLTGRIRVNA